MSRRGRRRETGKNKKRNTFYRWQYEFCRACADSTIDWFESPYHEDDAVVVVVVLVLEEVVVVVWSWKLWTFINITKNILSPVSQL